MWYIAKYLNAIIGRGDNVLRDDNGEKHRTKKSTFFYLSTILVACIGDSFPLLNCKGK